MYVVDTNVFVNAFNVVNFQAFPDFWSSFEDLIEKGVIISVSEVYKELDRIFISKSKSRKNDKIAKWLNYRKTIFIKPTNEECLIVSDVFKTKNYRNLVKEKSILMGSPEADAFIVAKAKSKNWIVVTNEKKKPNAPKIPNVCESFGVEYINQDEFFRIINENFKSGLGIN